MFNVTNVIVLINLKNPQVSNNYFVAGNVENSSSAGVISPCLCISSAALSSDHSLLRSASELLQHPVARNKRFCDISLLLCRTDTLSPIVHSDTLLCFEFIMDRYHNEKSYTEQII